MKKRYFNLRNGIIGLMLLGVTTYTTAQTTLTKVNGEAKFNTENIQSSYEAKPFNMYDSAISGTEPCITDQLMDDYLIENNLKEQFQAEYDQMLQDIEMNGGVYDKVQYTIPVIFHVVYNTNAHNVSNATIMAIFNQLNEDFQKQNADHVNARSTYGFTPADTEINFCLAQRDPQGNPLSEPGVIRKHTSTTYFDSDSNPNGMKNNTNGSAPWDRTKYLNVWIANISNGANYGVAGYAYLPSTSSLPPAGWDGVVIDYHLGTFLAGRTLTHEVGHYLGLPHTWGTSGSCTGNGGDGIYDTPPTAGPSQSYSGSCSGYQTTCSGIQTQYENYMDYSNCPVMFTEGQASVMRNILATSRASLQSSNGCTPVNVTQPPVANFTANHTTINVGGIVNFTDLSTNSPTSWSWSITPSSGWSYYASTNSTSQNPRVQFTSPGTYTVSLTATNSVGPGTETKTGYILVQEPIGGPTACDTLRNYGPDEGMTAFGITGETGYYPGHFTLSTQYGTAHTSRMAEKMTYNGTSQLRAIYFPVFDATDNGAPNDITFRIYNDDGGEPGGAPLASETMPLSSLNEGYWNLVEFSSPPTVSGDFWISFEWQNTGAFDEITFATTAPDDRPYTTGVSSTSFYVGSPFNEWLPTSAVFGPTQSEGYDVSMIVDALFSSGPAPIAAIDIDPSIACEGSLVTVDASNSTNANTYYWYFDSGSELYTGGGEAISFSNLPAGTWDVYLEANGSCASDLASGSLTITPSINFNHSVTDAHCMQAEGSITVTNITGGQGSGYQVSVDGGVNFLTNPPFVFNNLSAGTYQAVVQDGVCSDTITIVVADIDNFNPTISPGSTVTITEGNSTTLTVNGGASWEWHAGDDATAFSNNASVTVSPTETTTYTVIATDEYGCTKTFTITVNVVTEAETCDDVTNLIVSDNGDGTFTATWTGTSPAPANGYDIVVRDASNNVIATTNVNGTTYTSINVGNGVFSITVTAVCNEADGLYSDGVEASVNVQGSTSISVNEADVFKVYPNPVRNILTVETYSPEGTITVLDITGKVLSSKAVSETTTKVDVNHLPNGVYLLKYNSMNSNSVVKIIKQ